MQHISIRVSTLRGDQKIDFNAYVKINDKFILYLRQGDSFEGERLARLKSKKLKKMFILPDEENAYRAYVSRHIELAYNKNSGATLENRADIIQGSQQSNTEAVMEDPGNEVLYMDTKDAAGKFAQFIIQEDAAFNYLIKMENTDQNLAHHGVTVSTLAVAVAKKLGITDPKQLQLLTLGSLLHDFEHAHSGINIARPISDFTQEELTIYKLHPRAGATRVQDKKHFDPTVINIIVQHEEYIDGKGFPAGLLEAKLDPLAVITSSCNALDRLLTFEKIPKKDALKKLMMNHLGRHPLNHLQILTEIMNQVKT